MADTRCKPQRPIRLCLIMFAVLVALFGMTAPFVELPWWQYLGGGAAYSAFLSALSVGFLYVSRRVMVAFFGSVFILLLLFCAMLLLLEHIGSEGLDLWFAFLRPLEDMLKVVLGAAVLVSAIGWVRYLRGARKRVHRQS